METKCKHNLKETEIKKRWYTDTGSGSQYNLQTMQE